MSRSAGLAEYRAALTTHGARGPVVAAMLGRLPIAMVAFSLLLFVQRMTGSYASAGAVSAGVLFGVATGSIVQTRFMDRVGPTRPLLVTTLTFAGFVAATIVAVERGAPTALLVPLALGVGTAQPTIGSASRAMWTRLLPPGSTRNAALTYEAIVTEVYFIVGPAASGLLLTAPWPGTGVVVGAALMIVGTTWYALTPTMRIVRSDSSRVHERRLLGALGSRGLRTVALASLGMGLILGFVEVAVPAAASRAGSPASGGVLLGLWSISAAVFGIFYGTRPWPRSLTLRVPLLLGGFAVLVVPLTIPGSLLGLALLLLVAGTLISPQTAAHSECIEVVAVTGLVTESFGWMVTAATLGIGLGQLLSGLVVERAGVDVSFLTAAVIGSLVAIAVYLRRNTISERAVATSPQVVA